MIFSVMCIRFMAAMKSLTEVEEIRKAPIMKPGANLVMTEHTARRMNDAIPESVYNATRSSAKQTA